MVSDPDELLLSDILKTRFPTLIDPQLLISVYLKLKELYKDLRLRTLSLHDLIKWCDRVKSSSQDASSIFSHGYDCFVAQLTTEKFDIALKLGLMVDLEPNRVEFFLNHFVPTIKTTQENLTIGRITLPMSSSTLHSTNQVFAPTEPTLRLLEQLAGAVLHTEPILLVGETGTGKTTVVQQLANNLGKKLIILNMSQQSDSSDLLGGYKPIDQVRLANPVKIEFQRLFTLTFSKKSNLIFLTSIERAFNKRRWNHLISGFQQATTMAMKLFGNKSPDGRKRRKLDQSLMIEWENFAVKVRQLSGIFENANVNFSFIAGALVQAVTEGHWILLDELNLAPPEALDCLSGLLSSPTGSLLLLERGDTHPLVRDPGFRIFGCMNPANDAGKKQLPIGLQCRFTELWIDSPDERLQDLLLIIKSYLRKYLPPGKQGDVICDHIATFHQSAKRLSKDGVLFDGADQRVHISMRTLTRALMCATLCAPIYGLRRGIYEGIFMTFMTILGPSSFIKINELMYQHILWQIKNPSKFVSQVPPCPKAANESEDDYTLIDSFWIKKGPQDIPQDVTFILTPSIKAKLVHLVRACLIARYPVLIQGPTSAGKTSMIEYLAKVSGHKFIRINNHEHTDLAEYVGGYVSNNEGLLVFQEVFSDLSRAC